MIRGLHTLTDSSLVQPLVLTKLYRPRVGRELIQRPRLLEQLQSPPGLVLVIAPAGYGKTTLLSTWLNTCPLPSAWLSLDHQDSSLAVFTSYLITAIQIQFPAFGVEMANLLNGMALPPLAVISLNLRNELAALEQDFVLILDDFHVIRDSAIHQLLSDLLRHPPRALHLVLAARHDPALPLPELRARGDVLELRAADLRFTSAETANYLREKLRLPVDDQDVVTLNNRTEGWAAGLHLVALYFRHSGARHLIEANRTGDNRYLLDYLTAEVLSQLPLVLQDFLLKTSILDELCAPLCDAVIGSTEPSGDSLASLEWVHNADLFLSLLRDEPRWYRYHHLFREFLKQQLALRHTPEEIAVLHLRASAWLVANGHLDEALQHGMAAGNTTAAGRIVAQHRHALMNQKQWQRLSRWIQLFSHEAIDEQPDLLLATVWMEFIGQRLVDVPAALDRVEALIQWMPPEVAEPLQGEVDARRCAQYYWANDLTRSLKAGTSALQKVPAEWWYIRGYTRLFVGTGHQMLGDLTQAYAMFYVTGEPDQGRGYQDLLLSNACFVHWAAADLSGLAQAARQVVAGSDPFDRRDVVTWSRYHLGLYYYQRNELAAAEEYLQPLVMQPYQLYTLCYLNSAVLLARIRQLQGRPEEAQAIVNALFSFAHEARSDMLVFSAKAFQAELALRQGRVAEAGQWAAQYGSFRLAPIPHAFVPPITLVQVLLAQGTPASRQQARQLLLEMNDYFTSIHYTVIVIRVLALQAMLHDAEGEEQAALAALEKSVGLAEPGGFIRLFLDLGKPLKFLLLKLAQRGVSTAYLAQILAAFGPGEMSLGPEPGKTAPSSAIAPSSAPLTNREQEVLELLARRYSNKEIAEALSISQETVNSHIDHLGVKLGVRGRHAIVQAAKDQGLLT
jgi:LuxR family maltose regulon positive regulatory protein